jgi:phospholipid/cholesterol/gamma-HCH transport system ATP-binding protein
MNMENDGHNPVIRVQGLSKSFGAQKVLDGIDLEVSVGETLTVLGRSGTGKSVMLKLLIGLQKPDGGEIEIDGEEITTMPLDELNRIRKRVGFLFQGAALYDSLTAEENVAFPLRRHMDMTDGERRDRVGELLSRVGMGEDGKKMPSAISGGMKKRVGLARALALDPEILLLDEPTAGLDPITASEITGLIRDLQRERSISSIVVTHDMRSVEDVADRVAMLTEGRILIEGTLGDLRQSGHPLVSRFIQEHKEQKEQKEVR